MKNQKNIDSIVQNFSESLDFCEQKKNMLFATNLDAQFYLIFQSID